jgi:nucleotide-binding universal stress UspA family protein
VAIGRSGRQLLYDAPFALALAARGVHESNAQLGGIAVGYDGGPESQHALALAAELARAADARLLVRRVVEDQVPAFTPEEWMNLEDWDHDHIWEGVRHRALTEAEAAVSALGVSAETTATVGDPGYDLRRVSKTVDLVVLGSRRWGPIARLVTGGVGETLVTDSECSIIIVPRPSGNRRARKRSPTNTAAAQ